MQINISSLYFVLRENNYGKSIFKNDYALNHLRILDDIFRNSSNFFGKEIDDYAVYKENSESITNLISELKIDDQLYSQKGRQMILADLFEYMFLGRGYYSLDSLENKLKFIKLTLYFVNLLMSYEVLTVSDSLRQKVLKQWKQKIPILKDESKFTELELFKGKIGLKEGESDATKDLDRYFDSLLPKTAGGLWHELLVYIFLLRNNIGYIIPLLLSQRIIGLNDNLIPPDFLVITHDKNLYGIEVGIKKEIQSGSFSLQTNIPTATIDTINSRSSDRCPICKRWIPFCSFVIQNYSEISKMIDKYEVRCIDDCQIYTKDEILNGRCVYTKYSRNKAKTLEHTNHAFADGLHYHYKCVLDNLDKDIKEKIIKAKDSVALKTHYPFYSGLEALMSNQ